MALRAERVRYSDRASLMKTAVTSDTQRDDSVPMPALPRHATADALKEAEVLQGGQLGVEGQLRADHSQPLTAISGGKGLALLFDDHEPPRRPQQAGDHQQEGRLARTIGPSHNQHL